MDWIRENIESYWSTLTRTQTSRDMYVLTLHGMARTRRRFSRVPRRERILLGDLQVELPEGVGLAPPRRRRRRLRLHLLQLNRAHRGRRSLTGIQIGNLRGKCVSCLKFTSIILYPCALLSLNLRTP